MSQKDSFIHLFAGGVAGTVGAIVTCPLEVVKTRQQSSHSNLILPQIAEEINKTTCCNRKIDHNKIQRRRLWTGVHQCQPQVMAISGYVTSNKINTLNIIDAIKFIVRNEGPMALFKGLGPNLVGVAPSRAIYFATYSQTKQFWNAIFPPDSPIVHVCSASCAGFVASTTTNPIWFVKTRLQLDVNKNNNMSAWECVRRIYGTSGILGFYKGITASYIGISETIIHFVIYEALKAELVAYHRTNNRYGVTEKSSKDFFEFMAAGAISKTIASCIAYPHEVARTRLREEGTRYTSFWQTLALVYREEGLRGVYRGLSTQLIRQIPNTAIMMATYEAVVYVLTTRVGTEFYDKN